mgnify:FL=1
MAKCLWVVLTALVVYALWLFQPVKIMAVHKEYGAATVLVENFPIWPWWQEAWFNSHQADLEKRYGIPVSRRDGSWSIFFMGWQGGYRKDSLTDEDSDLLCFDDMNTDVNCILKEPLLWVSRNASGVVNYR